MYKNTFNVPKEVLQRRINAISPGSIVWLTYGIDEATNTNLTIVNTDSALDVTLINNAIQQPVTQEETDWMNERQQIKAAYQTMITRLENIQAAGVIPFTQAGFNQVVQAVKDEALYIERVMKVLKDISW